MIILVFVTLAVFRPVIGHQFLAYDDSVNVYKNPYFQARSLDNLLHFWRYPYEALYAPLTYTLWALTAWAPALLSADPSAAVAPDPRLFHSLNLLLHLLSVLIVWRILELILRLRRPTGTETAVDGTSLPLEWAACGGALLFAIHPIQVEPVAWVTGLKDVLFRLLYLGAVWHYMRYVDARMPPGTGRPSRARLHYGLATGAFVLALLAKPTAVVLPVTVWLLTAWGWRWRRSWREQIAGLSVWVIIAVAWGLTRPKKKLVAICGAIVLGLFLLRSAWQIPYWHDTLTFFEHALQVNSNSHLTHNNLGFALTKQGKDVADPRSYRIPGSYFRKSVNQKVQASQNIRVQNQ